MKDTEGNSVGKETKGNMQERREKKKEGERKGKGKGSGIEVKRHREET